MNLWAIALIFAASGCIGYEPYFQDTEGTNVKPPPKHVCESYDTLRKFVFSQGGVCEENVAEDSNGFLEATLECCVTSTFIVDDGAGGAKRVRATPCYSWEASSSERDNVVRANVYHEDEPWAEAITCAGCDCETPRGWHGTPFPVRP